MGWSSWCFVCVLLDRQLHRLSFDPTDGDDRFPQVCQANILAQHSHDAALFCLNVSIIFPCYFLKDQEDSEFYRYCIVAEILSCIAVLGHLVEVWIMWIDLKCYIAAGPGLLQVSLCCRYVSECLLACIPTQPRSGPNHSHFVMPR